MAVSWYWSRLCWYNKCIFSESKYVLGNIVDFYKTEKKTISCEKIMRKLFEIKLECIDK